MKTKLPFLMMALLPFAGFGQSVAKSSVYPVTQKAVQKAATIVPSKAPTAYCAPVDLICSDGDLITNVTFGTINNASECGTGGYNDFTAMSTEVTPGAAMPLSVTVGDGWFERVSAWVDWNNNEIFEETELMTANVGPLGTSGEEGDMGLGGGTDAGGVLSGDITIPADVAAGSYRMRIMVFATGSSEPAVSDACYDLGYGEVEDYTLVVPVTGGCLDTPNGLYPSSTFTPNCNGTVQNVTGAAWLGEYSNVQLTAGTAYTFSSSVSTHQITIADATGTTILAAGIGSVVYTPTANGVVRFITHLNADCGVANTIHAKRVSCGTPPPPPTNCEDFKVLSNNLENGGFLGGDTAQKLAADLPIGDQPLTISGMEPTLIGEATYVNFVVYEDAAGLPGAQVATINGNITGSTVTGQNFGFDFIKYTVEFDNPVALAANTKYWIEVLSDADGWESTAATSLGSKDAFNNNSSGNTWALGTADYVFNLICTEIAVGEVNSKKVSYYPNPVRDILTITSKQKIETVHVYNVAGQKMNVPAKMNNNQIDMSRMAPGVYIISTIAADGTNESFKVIKK